MLSGQVAELQAIVREGIQRDSLYWRSDVETILTEFRKEMEVKKVALEPEVKRIMLYLRSKVLIADTNMREIFFILILFVHDYSFFFNICVRGNLSYKRIRTLLLSGETGVRLSEPTREYIFYAMPDLINLTRG